MPLQAPSFFSRYYSRRKVREPNDVQSSKLSMHGFHSNSGTLLPCECIPGIRTATLRTFSLSQRYILVSDHSEPFCEHASSKMLIWCLASRKLPTARRLTSKMRSPRGSLCLFVEHWMLIGLYWHIVMLGG